MYTTLKRATAPLLSTVSQFWPGCTAARLLVRRGRHTSVVETHAEAARPLTLRSRLIDDVAAGEIVAAASPEALPEVLQPIATIADASPLTICPIPAGAGGPNLGLLLFSHNADAPVTDAVLTLIRGVAQTIGVVLEALDSTEGQSAASLHDALTHLPNKSLFADRLTDEIGGALRSNARLGVLTIDLDGFATINAQHGRHIGDRVLQKIAARLHHAVRRSDFLARLSEDEFGLIAPTLNEPFGGAHVAQRLLKIINQPLDVDGIVLVPSASIGIAVTPHDGTDVEQLLLNSHTAMHRAKMRGQNQFEYCTPQMNADAMERLELESRLRLAIDKHELLLHYQPVVDAEKRVKAVEALIRWQQPEGMISPAKFIPIAETTGLIVPIGAWVLKTACTQAAAWAEAGMAIPVNVNVSTLQFAKDDFVEAVFTTLRETGLPPQMLVIEVTESVLGQNSGEIAKKLTALRAAGVQIAIDDFGAGYSSLSRVHALPIDTLKVDREFVNAITENPDDAPLHHRTAVLRAVATLAHSLGLKLVAEGVENESQARFLRRIGYDGMQGYLFSKPVPADKIPGVIEQLGLAPVAAPVKVAQAA